MNKNGKTRIPDVLERHEAALLADWVSAQKAAPTYRPDLIKEGELREQSREFLRLLARATRVGDADIQGEEWKEARDLLGSISRSRGQQGFSPSATATFVFSFKEPLFEILRRELASDPKALAEETWTASILLDKLGLYTTEVHQKAREEVIERQQREVLELSTPVVK